MGIDVRCLPPKAQEQIFQKLASQGLRKAARGAVQDGRRKYHNEPAERCGIRFDSKKEARRYDELMMLQSAGLISELKLQPQFTLQESFVTPTGERVQAIRYVADFSYVNALGEKIVEDVKSTATKTQKYEIKRKMMLDKFGISIREV